MSDTPAMNTPEAEGEDLPLARAYESTPESENPDRYRNEQCDPAPAPEDQA